MVEFDYLSDGTCSYGCFLELFEDIVEGSLEYLLNNLFSVLECMWFASGMQSAQFITE